jgi:penicillin-insensitive murein endopeptidase
MRLVARIVGILALTLAVGSASAAPAKTKTPSANKARRAKDADKPSEKLPKGSLSVGAPNAGKLVKGEQLASNRSIEVRGGGHAYGTPQLVGVLKRAAAKVRKKYKGSVLFVGDMSAKRGGALFGHNSHQSGRDADVGFYMKHDGGKQVNPHRFIAFGSDGKARDGAIARFDDERNWAFVEALITDAKVDVRYLFVSMGLRRRLLTYAAKIKVPQDIYTKASATLMSPADVDVHDDHFHVRIACPEKMRPHCVEESYLGRSGGASNSTAPKQSAATAGAPAREEAKEFEAKEAKEVKEAKEAEADKPRAPGEGSGASEQ